MVDYTATTFICLRRTVKVKKTSSTSKLLAACRDLAQTASLLRRLSGVVTSRRPCRPNRGSVVHWHEENHLQRVSVFARDHPAVDLALPSVLFELPRHRGFVGRTQLKLMREFLRKYGSASETCVTDNLRSYSAAARDREMGGRRCARRWRNNWAENRHQPTRRSECETRRFKSVGSAQRFLPTPAAVHNAFNAQCHFASDTTRRACRAAAMNTRRGAALAA